MLVLLARIAVPAVVVGGVCWMAYSQKWGALWRADGRRRNPYGRYNRQGIALVVLLSGLIAIPAATGKFAEAFVPVAAVLFLGLIAFALYSVGWLVVQVNRLAPPVRTGVWWVVGLGITYGALLWWTAGARPGSVGQRLNDVLTLAR